MAKLPGNGGNSIQVAVTDSGDGPTFVLPEGIDLAQVSFEQSGEDLVLTGADGFHMVMRGFFTGEETPTLVAADGKVIPGVELEQLISGAQTEISAGEVSEGGDLEDFETAVGDGGEVDPLNPDDTGSGDTDTDIGDGAENTDGENPTGEPDPQINSNVESAPQLIAAPPPPLPSAPPPPLPAPPPSPAPIEVRAAADEDAPPSNAAPRAVDITGVSADEDGSSQGRLSAFDGDGDGLTFSVAGNGHPAHGHVTVSPNGTYAYTPDPDFSGADEFSFVVSDGRGGVDRGSVSFDVRPQADAPQVSATDAAGTETVAIELDIAAHLSDTDGSETLSVEVSGLPAGAVLSAGSDNGDGTWTLEPDDLAGLNLTVPAGAKGTYSLSVEAIAEETSGGEARTETTFQLNIDPLMTNSLNGSDANNTLRGTEANDAISGEGGNDSLYGRDGDDTLSGGSGADRLYGENGDDVISGGEGADRLYGQAGADELRGGDGADYLYADADDTVIDGGEGLDRLYVEGTRGVSVDLAAASIELAYGAAGDDTFDGSGLTANTSLYGRDGDDTLSGGSGADRLYGENGDDVILGGDGADRLYGGAGRDTFIFEASGGQDRVYDFAAGDELWFEGAEFSADSLIFSQTGNDALVSFDGVDGLSIRLSGIDADDLAGWASGGDDAFIVSIDAVG